eukprot:scaffold4456_cov164-Amphora_coffeaeformis.AAC.2
MPHQPEPSIYGSIPQQQDDDSSEPRPQHDKGQASSNGARNLLLAFLGGLLFILAWYAYTEDRHRRGTGIQNGTSSTNEEKKFDMERFYPHQTVDHFGSSDNNKYAKATYTQRYFEDASFFKGPGHPIFVVMGGEDPVEQINYPWVSRSLAQSFGGITVCIEHRFYGKSQPIAKDIVTNADFRHLLHPRQALADAAQFIQDLQSDLGCGPRGSTEYCPVVTVGGSYPGFLSVLMRTVYPGVVDMAWGSSAPLFLYSHAVEDTAYFDKVTNVAEAYSPGCTEAVRMTLRDFQMELLALDSNKNKSLAQVAISLGICAKTIPEYIDSLDTLQQEVIMVIAEHFAENNMGFYPPGPERELVQGCHMFQQKDWSTHEKISAFLNMRTTTDTSSSSSCFDLVTELPPGPYGTISASDWSGTGGGHSGYMWDYQSCTLIPECSLSPESMFPPRKWSLAWLTQHCQRRFGMTPRLSALVEEFGFDDLSSDSHIVFTNGNNDGWYALSITEDVSDTIRTYNFPNGAHHSDLTRVGATDEDTPDIVEGHKQVTALLGSWLEKIMMRT